MLHGLTMSDPNKYRTWTRKEGREGKEGKEGREEERVAFSISVARQWSVATFGGMKEGNR